MTIPLIELLVMGGVSFLTTLLITPWVGAFAKRFGAIQESPAEVLARLHESKGGYATESKIIAARRRLDKPAKPLWGGIAYVVTFMVVSAVVLLSSKTINIPVVEFPGYLVWFAGIIVLHIIGILDDRFEFPGNIQLLFHLVATIILILSPIDLVNIRNPLTGGGLLLSPIILSPGEGLSFISLALPGDILLFFWVFLLINPIKWTSGADGLMESIVLAASIVISLVSIMYNQPASAVFAITLSGAMLGFLFYNWYPSKLMSGSAGKSVIGFIMAGLAVISNTKFAVALVVFALPIIDASWVLLRRLLHYKPKSVLDLLKISDRFHFHHRLMSMGWSEQKISLFEFALTLFSGIITVLLPTPAKTIFVLLYWIIIFIMVIYATRITSNK